jgi:hypothetical protein
VRGREVAHIVHVKAEHAEEADRDAAVAQLLGREGSTRGNAHAAADDGICAEIAGGRIGDVH